jgi:AcrR family transcriptional regulator
MMWTMDKIDRPHPRQEAILLAAMDLLATSGPDAVSMAVLAEKTGLSRPAIYQYFSSREHVLAELVINEMADLSNAIDRLVEGLDDPLEQVRVWIHYSLAHLASDQHAAIRKISMDSLPDSQRGVVRALHGYFTTTLVSPLTQLGIGDGPALAGMIFGAVGASAQRIAAGSSFAAEAAALEKFVVSGIEAQLAV